MGNRVSWKRGNQSKSNAELKVLVGGSKKALLNINIMTEC